jgi:hypothetical protein
LWKKLRLSFGHSSSVGGGVRKLGLGVAGTGDVISTDSLGCGISAGVVGYFEQEFQEKNMSHLIFEYEKPV